MRLQHWPGGLFLFGLLLGVAVIWASPHPPMLDLPQHAGQLRLLRDLLLGQSPWASLVEINLWTPYLIAFGLALPLSLLLPIATALQCVLTLAYLAFVYGCICLRREFRAPAALDWLFLFSFFGFAFKWGFMTFQVAAPFGLFFMLLAARYARAPGLRRGLLIFGLGLVLLISHALVFLYALMVAAALLALQSPRFQWRRLSLQALPYLLLFIVCIAYSVMRGSADARYGVPPSVPSVIWHAGLRHEVLFFSFGTGWTPVFVFACVAALAAPWLAGFRPGLRARLGLAPLGMLLLILLLAPHFAMETSMLYQRFALFLFPAYAWAFAGSPAPAGRFGLLSQALLAAGSLLVLLANGFWAWQYRSEAEDFSRVTQALAPAQRALALVFDGRSAADPTPKFFPNQHYASWYQAEHQGLVDMNFAIAPPQIVRFKPDQTPAVPLNFAWMPAGFDWKKHDGNLYRYFFIRGQAPDSIQLWASAPCPPVLRAAQGAWQVYERQACH